MFLTTEVGHKKHCRHRHRPANTYRHLSTRQSAENHVRIETKPVKRQTGTSHCQYRCFTPQSPRASHLSPAYPLSQTSFTVYQGVIGKTCHHLTSHDCDGQVYSLDNYSLPLQVVKLQVAPRYLREQKLTSVVSPDYV
jgi:hypothetical protein